MDDQRRTEVQLAQLIRFLGSGYAPKAAHEVPRKPWRLEPEDKRFLRAMEIKPD